MGFDFGKAIRLSFKWIELKESWKYALIIWGVSLLSILFAFVLAMLFFPSLANCLVFGQCKDPYPFLQMFTVPRAIWSFLTLIILFSLITGIFSFIVNSLGVALTQLFGLKSMNFKNPEFTFNKFLRYLWLLIATELVAWFWAFDKKLRAIQWICTGLIALVLVQATLAFMSAPQALFENTQFALTVLNWLLLALIVFIVWAIVAIYVSYRLFLSIPLFLNKRLKAVNALKKSWHKMKGNVLNVFVASMMVVIIVMVVFLGLGLILGLLGGLLFQPTSPASSLYVQAIDVLLAPIGVLIGSFFMAGIYSMLSTTPKPSKLKESKKEKSAVAGI